MRAFQLTHTCCSVRSGGIRDHHLPAAGLTEGLPSRAGLSGRSATLMRLTRGCSSAPLLLRGGALPSRGGARLSRLPAESFRPGAPGRALRPGAGLLSLLSDATSGPSDAASLPSACISAALQDEGAPDSPSCCITGTPTPHAACSIFAGGPAGSEPPWGRAGCAPCFPRPCRDAASSATKAEAVSAEQIHSQQLCWHCKVKPSPCKKAQRSAVQTRHRRACATHAGQCDDMAVGVSADP